MTDTKTLDQTEKKDKDKLEDEEEDDTASSGGGDVSSDTGKPATTQSYDDWLKQVMSELGQRPTQAKNRSAQVTPTKRMTGAAPAGQAKSRGFVAQALRDRLFGDPANRQTISDATKERISEKVAAGQAKPVAITSSNGNTLSGNFFSRKGHSVADDAAPDTTQPVVLYLSGSGGSAEDYGMDMADFYQDSGASVLVANYGGYGEYKNGDEKPEPSEQSILEDAQAMLDHLIDLGYPPDKIILHGYSMGGAVAGKLQTHNERTDGGGAGMKFRGMVLDRPMMSNTAGVQGHAGEGPMGKIGGFMTRKLIGSMSARKAMAASNSDTPLVIGTEEPTKVEDGVTSTNVFATRVDELRTRMRNAPVPEGGAARRIVGKASDSNHFDHLAAIKANGDYMKSLIDTMRDGTPDKQPVVDEVALDLATARQLRKKIMDAAEKLGTEAQDIASQVAQEIGSASKDTGKRQEAAKTVTRLMARLDEIIDEASQMQVMASELKNEDELKANVESKVRAILMRSKNTKDLCKKSVLSIDAPLLFPSDLLKVIVEEMKSATESGNIVLKDYDELRNKRKYQEEFKNVSKLVLRTEGKRTTVEQSGGTWDSSSQSVVQKFVTMRTALWALPEPVPAPPPPKGLKGLLAKLPKPGRRTVSQALTQ